MITARVYAGGVVEEVDSQRVSEALHRPDTLVWVDVAEPDEADLDCIQKQFSLHALAMEDVRELHQRAKLEHYPTHSFVVAYSSGLDEVDLFLGPTWLVSVREAETNGSPWNPDAARARFERTRPEHVSAGYLLYILLDELVDGYFDATDRAEDALEELEERIFGEELADERTVQQELFDIRRRLLVFRRAVVPLREVVASLMRREVTWIDDATATMLQDVYDHVLRAVDLLDGQRELMGNAVDAHLAIISNRMNQVMKKMTSWGAIILGSTLIAGIYGMNFENMPELRWHYGYFAALALMATLTLIGYRYFRKKDWL
ncbi:MAG TPA: magnesium/cobalt transporter CorA [Acidimicrobiales bacterium]|nr:magnesium/cobalt transporter CorA [Acidimicrobiales bacterium]